MVYHSGKVTLKIMSAQLITGGPRTRTDIENSPIVKADAKTVGATEDNTTLGSGVSAIHTVEHLISILLWL